MSLDKDISTAIDHTKSDLTLYGCTSFTGKHVLNYLIQTSLDVPFKVIVTLAGRDTKKIITLKDVMEKKMNNLLLINNNTTSGIQFRTCTAESTDKNAIKDMVQQTKVVLSCAGPFAKYSSNVVGACAEYGTDYVDITGEVTWSSEMRLKYGENARKSGARIISFCGFDSIPSDIAIFAAVQALKEKLKESSGKNNATTSIEIKEGVTWHYGVGGVNGGTIQTVLGTPLNLQQNFSGPFPFLMDDPLALAPPRIRLDPKNESDKIRLAKTEWLNQFISFDPFTMGFSIPFFMAPINAKIVHATAVALNYGKQFTYRERLVPVGFKFTSKLKIFSIIPAICVQVSLIAMMVIIKTPFIGKYLVNSFLPPGSGPSDDMCRDGTTEVYAQVTTEKDGYGAIHKGYCHIQFQGDPGNYVTAQCICESAWSLLFNRSELPIRSDDGFGTPAELLGTVLVNRLQKTKIRPVEFKTTVRKNASKYDWMMYT